MNFEPEHISFLIKEAVKSIDKNAEIILYGSRARGEAKKHSDWDILILTDYNTDIFKERIFRNRLYDLELETGETFSVLIYSKKDWNTIQKATPFYHNVSKEGIML